MTPKYRILRFMKGSSHIWQAFRFNPIDLSELNNSYILDSFWTKESKEGGRWLANKRNALILSWLIGNRTSKETT